ncbi:hypothetical protein AB1L30_24595 [Bremerella sp. JC817]|uniref:hypothetical protein n=1 Tax=Bremerella sp. JC817 TaxID=3231756 RepID=UPI00345869CF
MERIFEADVLFAPFFIYVRCAGEYSDADFLALFEVRNYKRKASVSHECQSAAISSVDGWMMLADDWGYTLWNRPATHRTIGRLAQQYDLFTCFLGDIDDSYHFVLYRDGRRIREYQWLCPALSPPRATIDYGIPLPGEAEANLQADHWKRIVEVAESLGLKGHRRESSIRYFAP